MENQNGQLEVKSTSASSVSVLGKYNSFQRAVRPSKYSQIGDVDEDFKTLGLHRQGAAVEAINRYDTAVSADGTAVMFCVTKNRDMTQLYVCAEELISFQLSVNNEVVHSTGSGGTVLGALAGGALAGGAGAIVGALAVGNSAPGKRTQTLRSVELKLSLNSVERPHITFSLLDQEITVSGANKQKVDRVIKQAETWLSLLEILKTRRAISPAPFAGQTRPDSIFANSSDTEFDADTALGCAVLIVAALALWTVFSDGEEVIGEAVVAAKSLNVRACPSSDCAIAGSLTLNDAVSIYEEKDGWTRVSEDQEWVSSNYLATAPQAVTAPDYREIVAQSVDASPSDDLAIHRNAFVTAGVELLENKQCTVEQIESYGMWLKSTTHGAGVYFTYCQDGPLTSSEGRYYLNATTGELWQ